MTEHVMEIVRFKTVAGADDAKVISAAAAIAPWLSAQPGFVARRLSQMDDATWIDIVEWSGMPAAKAAAEAIMAAPAAGAFMALIDADSVDMTHALVRTAQTR